MTAATPPKGRATRARNDDIGRGAILSAKLQWALAILVALVVLGAIFYFGRDVRSDLNGSPAAVATHVDATATTIGTTIER